MNLKDFIYVYLPLFLISLFTKIFLASFFLIYPGNIFFALFLVILIFIDVDIYSCVYVFILGYVSGLDNNLELLTSFYFLLILLLSKKIKNICQFEFFKMRVYWWVINLLIFLIFQDIIYRYRLSMSINRNLFFHIITKDIFYFFTTFFWILIFNKILSKILIIEE